MKDRIARTLTDWAAPWVVIIAMCLAVAWHATGSVGGTLLWGGVVAVFTSVVPMGIIQLLKRHGRVSDIHIHHRRHRIVPLIGIVISAAIGLATMYLTGADPAILTLAWALLTGVVTTGLITTIWKISFHTGVSAAAFLVMAILYHPLWLCGMALVAAIGWSRVHVKDHTTAQVIVGAFWGALTTAVIYLLAT